jgi:putative flippase GtrA
MKKVVDKLMHQQVIEIFVYGIVGGGAWVIQTLIYTFMLKLYVFPSVSMLLGNFAGMLFSYYGHVKFTFKKGKFSHKEFVKFTITSIIGLCINVGGVRVVTKVLHLNPHYAIIPTIFTPLITFVISKFWAFK